jgi:hypothetical protein
MMTTCFEVSTFTYLSSLLRLPTESEIKKTYIADYDRAYGPTYTVLDILQNVFFYNNGTSRHSASPNFVHLDDVIIICMFFEPAISRHILFTAV